MSMTNTSAFGEREGSLRKGPALGTHSRTESQLAEEVGDQEPRLPKSLSLAGHTVLFTSRMVRTFSHHFDHLKGTFPFLFETGICDCPLQSFSCKCKSLKNSYEPNRAKEIIASFSTEFL